MRHLVCGLAILAMTGMAHDVLGADDEKFELEPGFALFFNDKDLTGWTVRGGESLDGKTEAPMARFQVAEGKIIIDGKAKGNMVIDTVKPFAGDVHLKFQYLPSEGCNNDLYFRGVKFDIKKGDVKNVQFGKWNELELIVHGTELEIKNNGETQQKTTTKSDSTPLGIRAEFGAIEFRRMRFK